MPKCPLRSAAGDQVPFLGSETSRGPGGSGEWEKGGQTQGGMHRGEDGT
jgi:hypothetical protein